MAEKQNSYTNFFTSTSFLDNSNIYKKNMKVLKAHVK